MPTCHVFDRSGNLVDVSSIGAVCLHGVEVVVGGLRIDRCHDVFAGDHFDIK